ncbi:hypothetical protein KR51_00010140 [Rubidibacter lacunae KORDI 51-2]|uniref:Uncharacterized protein n=1 Tax=Rubidibacter lacunae KORDI 51-2 TaxID=582515 RepID=U5DRK5_9CHRO|nr:hypothetical protein KR51_00010140 [Rubidibacter lacunae KORDI 51-2]
MLLKWGNLGIESLFNYLYCLLVSFCPSKAVFFTDRQLMLLTFFEKSNQLQPRSKLNKGGSLVI